MTLLHESLRTHFGFSTFRPGQAEALQSLSAGHHTLVVMPTGAGKSLVFQLAALTSGSQTPPFATTLVISPLIALMKDQVDSLTRRGIPAVCIHSALPSAEQAQRIEGLARGSYRLVYIAPERLRSKPFLEAMRQRTINLLAVDEAHCISEWGHDFRPDYLHIAQWRKSFFPDVLSVALTATATPQVQKDILRLLGLEESVSTCIVTGFNRPNLSLNVRYLHGLPAKLRTLNELLAPRQPGATIVYTGTRRDTEEVAEFVREVIHIPVERYHAGLPAEERARVQDAFISGKVNLVVTTNAFGMGIDRADVRQVIHYSLPGSLEAYYQEAGRAGRDGLPARATLLYDPQDRALHEFFMQQSELASADLNTIYTALPKGKEIWTTIDDLSRQTGLHPVHIKVGLSALEQARALEPLGDEGIRILYRRGIWNLSDIQTAILASKQHIQSRQQQLTAMITYAESNHCRRRIILSHFGDRDFSQVLECCDNCQSQATPPAASGNVSKMNHAERAGLIILDCIRRLPVKVGREKLAQVLRGSKAQEMIKFRYDQTVYYGRLAALTQAQIEDFIEQLMDLGYIKGIGGEYPVVCLSPAGENAIRQKKPIPLTLPQGVSAQSIRNKQAQNQAGGTVELTEQLLQNGATPEQVAQERGLATGTIYSHCVRLLTEGKIRLEQVIPAAIQREIDEAIMEVGSVQSITPIKMLLPDTIEYNMIRCVLTARPQPPYPPLNANSAPPDAVTAFLTRSHPCALSGSWHIGWALGFHSRLTGGDWARSGVGDLTYRLKYEGDASVLPALVAEALELIQAHPELHQVDAITPVPPSLERKVDPVLAFCKALAAKLNLPVQLLVSKTRRTQPQKNMKTLAQKRTNVAGAFGLRGEVRGKRILLVDDLFDSGATLEEISRLLLQHKATFVNVLTLTRTIHSDS
jgi:ATP-dependent DNA helicase RecQ